MALLFAVNGSTTGNQFNWRMKKERESEKEECALSVSGENIE